MAVAAMVAVPAAAPVAPVAVAPAASVAVAAMPATTASSTLLFPQNLINFGIKNNNLIVNI